jgi:hypothetical protein
MELAGTRWSSQKLAGTCGAPLHRFFFVRTDEPLKSTGARFFWPQKRLAVETAKPAKAAEAVDTAKTAKAVVPEGL